MAKPPCPTGSSRWRATLTQERFAGDDWLFERKFDGIRLLAYKRGNDVKLFSRNRLLQTSPVRRRRPSAQLPVKDAILDGEVAWDRRQRLPRLRHPLAQRQEGHRPAARGTPRAAEITAIHGADAARRPARRRRAVGARATRRLGRRHRQATRLAVRTPPLEAMAEDEDRSARRSWWSAASPIRKARASASARCWSGTTTATTSCSRERSAPASTPSCCSICASASMRSRSRSRRSRSRDGLPRLRAHWVRP